MLLNTLVHFAESLKKQHTNIKAMEKIKDKKYYKELLQNSYISAALDTIAKAEGVKYGYYTLYGNTKIESLKEHPNRAITKWGITSTAAGRYQFLYKTWVSIAKKLKLDSFSPENQDIAALYLIDEKGAISDLMKGDVLTAFYKIRKIWASLPAAGYGQGERSEAYIKQWFDYYVKNAKPSSQGVFFAASIALILLLIIKF